MRIGIDARSILNPEKSEAIGVGHYTYQLIRHLLKIDQENEYVLFFDYHVREKDVQKFSKQNVTIKYFPWSDYKKYLPGAYSEILGLATISGYKLDVLHCTSPDARVPLGYRGKVLCTFQDLAMYQHPALFSKVKTLRTRYNRQAMAKRADKIIAVSENTRQDLQQIFHLDEKQIEVIRNGVDARFFEPFAMDKQTLKDELAHKFKLEKDYILFLGTLEPVKNVSRLLEAFKAFKEHLKQKGKKHDYQLAIAGKRGWLAQEYIQTAKDLNIIDDVRFLGYVQGDEVVKLFNGAKLFVMPSLYEGFGMSVLEAMASGVPCLVSDISPLREIGEHAVEYVNPLDVEGMVDKLVEMVENTEHVKELAIKGKEQAKKFSWDDCAQKTLDLYHRISGK
jgi:glycosyltransferase involved in cell wall biosynthesis